MVPVVMPRGMRALFSTLQTSAKLSTGLSHRSKHAPVAVGAAAGILNLAGRGTLTPAGTAVEAAAGVREIAFCIRARTFASLSKTSARRDDYCAMQHAQPTHLLLRSRCLPVQRVRHVCVAVDCDGCVAAKEQPCQCCSSFLPAEKIFAAASASGCGAIDDSDFSGRFRRDDRGVSGDVSRMNDADLSCSIATMSGPRAAARKSISS